MSIIVALVGPIEFWWDTPDDPNRFMSPRAVAYRKWRIALRDYLANEGMLVYSPHLAFYGPWDERAQAHNDFIIGIVDVVVNMRPAGVPGAGTDHELELARQLGRPIVNAAEEERTLGYIRDEIRQVAGGLVDHVGTG